MQILNLLESGPLDYLLVDAIQRRLNQEVGQLTHPDTFIAWEARDVYTAGRRTKAADIPNHETPVIQMDRGGSVTYHGPGQLVLYPIVKVQAPHDVVKFVRKTEIALIQALKSVNLISTQVAGRSGVWIQKPAQQDEKICAIGIKFTNETSMHGLALNVTTELEKFAAVVPCGITDAGVTSLQAQGITTTLPTALQLIAPQLNQAYQEFTLPGRFQSELHQLDPAPYLAQAQHDLHTRKLPAKTGIEWKPKAEIKEEK